MQIHVFNEQTDLPIKKQSVKQVVKCVLSLLDVHTNEVGIYFVSTDKICSMHAQYFQDPSVTDCITFPIDSENLKVKGCLGITSGYHILGEIFICPKTAIDYVAKRPQTAHHEVTLYLIHGILHLLGFDDLTEYQRRKMKREEKKIMKLLEEKGILLS